MALDDVNAHFVRELLAQLAKNGPAQAAPADPAPPAESTDTGEDAKPTPCTPAWPPAWPNIRRPR